MSYGESSGKGHCGSGQRCAVEVCFALVELCIATYVGATCYKQYIPDEVLLKMRHAKGRGRSNSRQALKQSDPQRCGHSLRRLMT